MSTPLVSLGILLLTPVIELISLWSCGCIAVGSCGIFVESPVRFFLTLFLNTSCLSITCFGVTVPAEGFTLNVPSDKLAVGTK